MSYAVGSLVKARGREWVVLPESEEDMLVLRPLGGTEDEVAGVYLPLETVEPATFDLPDPDEEGRLPLLTAPARRRAGSASAPARARSAPSRRSPSSRDPTSSCRSSSPSS